MAKLPTKWNSSGRQSKVKRVAITIDDTGKVRIDQQPSRMNVSKRIAQRKSKKVRPTKRVKGSQRP